MLGFVCSRGLVFTISIINAEQISVPSVFSLLTGTSLSQDDFLSICFSYFSPCKYMELRLINTLQ